jgi:lysophospholipase L1-like esterase
MPRTSTLLAAALGVLALVVGCSPSEPPPPETPSPTPTLSSSPSPVAPSTGPTYVALGDSFTAGGLIGSIQQRGFRCGRSTQNYPSIVATTLGLPLTDVSCGGAGSADVLGGSRGLPAQIDAVTPRTRVVTVSIGGNDFNLYAKLIRICSLLSGPKEATGSPCRDRLDREITPAIPSIGTRVGDVLGKVRAKAPDATVLLVGYPRLMPTSGSCRDAPYSPADVAWVASLESQLASAMRSAARQRDVAFVPMHSMSKGHDVCQGHDAWVNGLHPATGDGLLLHPNAAGQRAIGRAVVAALRSAGVG